MNQNGQFPLLPTTEMQALETKQVLSSVSYMYMYTYIPFTVFFSMMFYHRILNAVLCAMQEYLVVYRSYV